MDIGTQFFQTFLVLHTEMLFFINDEQSKISELDLTRQQRMGANYDINAALSQLFLGKFQLFAANQPRCLGNAQRQAFKTLDKVLEVLARQQGCGHNQCHLLSCIGCYKGGAQSHFRFAKANVATNQSVHRAAFLQIIQYCFNRRKLVFCLFIGKACGELIKGTFWWGQYITRFQFTGRRSLDQVIGNFADAILELCLLCLPSTAAQLIELHAFCLRAIAR